MRILIQNTHLFITDALREYIQRRLAVVGRVVHSFETSRELLLRTTIGRTTQHHHKGDAVYYVELLMDLPHKMIRIEEYGANARITIDRAQKRMKHTVQHYKDRITKKSKAKN